MRLRAAALALCVMVFAAAVAAQNTGRAVTPAAAPRTQLVLLGTGTPNADPDRSGPSLAVVVDGIPYVVDAGPGVVRRAAAAVQRGVAGLAPKLLRTAFITHLHSDHTLGYPDLIFTPAVLERGAPLDVYGPRGLKDMTDHLLKAWSADMDVRLKDLEPSQPEGYKVVVHEMAGPGQIFKDERVTVRAFRVSHGAWPEAYGFRFDTPDRSIVVSGDSAPDERVAQACNGCDILVHEVYSTEGFAKRPPEWQRYHRAYHTSSAELAMIATKAKPRLLVLTHQLFWGTSDQALVAEVARGYAGKVVSGRDLDIF